MDDMPLEAISNYEQVVRRARAQTPEQLYDLRAKMLGAYTAFVGAALLASVTNAVAIGGGHVIVSLLALSLPALVAQLLLDRTVTVIQRRKASGFRGLARFVGIGCSMAAFTLLVGHASVFAGVVFVFGSVVWFAVVDLVTAAGAHSVDGQI